MGGHSDGPSDEDTTRRYGIGIDLGTTHCVLSYVDYQNPPARPTVLDVPQSISDSVTESRQNLPSFHYQPPGGRPAVVGEAARRAAADAPDRVIASAKSWLAHRGVDRSAPILPWHGDVEVDRLSPAQVSAAYLKHLADAWDLQFPGHPIGDQDVTITLPASFDQTARELTAAAARLAGLPVVSLIEEPQAATYAWIDRHEATSRSPWTDQLRAGELLLVIDIGGGTTDLTLIRVRRAGASIDDATLQSGGALQLHRVAVGEHLLLGGDNLDLAIAKRIETDAGGELDPAVWQSLVAQCRGLKEWLLGPSAPPATTLTISRGGASLMGDARRFEVDSQTVADVVLDGFFPVVGLDASPQHDPSGFREFGLPYASDPAITRHLASFVRTHRRTGRDVDPAAVADNPQSDLQSDRVDAVLLNGGVLASPAIADRIMQTVGSWFPGHEVKRLDCPHLMRAVADGAAVYNRVRRGQGTSIVANLARTYLVQIDADPPRAVCLIGADARPGDVSQLGDLPLDLTIGEPMRLAVHSSSTRLELRPGDVVPIDEQQMTPLPPITTVIRGCRASESGTLSVTLAGQTTEIGTVAMQCVEVIPPDQDRSPRRWKLDFDIRGTLRSGIASHAGGDEAAGVLPQDLVDDAVAIIDDVFVGKAKQAKLFANLEAALGLPRTQWPPVAMRQLWSHLMSVSEQRGRSVGHQNRWLAAVGYTLRPGDGIAADDWRCGEVWRSVYGRLQHPGDATADAAWILWRRIAAGLTAGQQLQLHDQVRPTLGGGGATVSRSVEAWRAAGALERLPVVLKIGLADLAAATLGRAKSAPAHAAAVGALGRIAARQLAYGPAQEVVPPSKAQSLAEALIDGPAAGAAEATETTRRAAALALTLIGRRTGDRLLDLPVPAREAIADRIEQLRGPEQWIAAVRHGGQLDRQTQAAIAGDHLPLGLTLR